MPRRRANKTGWFKFLLALVVICVCAGGVAAWVTRYNVTRHAAGEPGLDLATVNVGNARGGFTTNARELGTLSREQLVSEVARLNSELADRNRQIDDLKIQLKLMSDGSRSATNQ